MPAFALNMQTFPSYQHCHCSLLVARRPVRRLQAAKHPDVQQQQQTVVDSKASQDEETTRWLLQAFREGTLHHPASVLGGLTGFALIAAAIVPATDQAQAADMFATAEMAPQAPGSPLLALDQAVHQLVVANISPPVREYWADIIMSDTCITAGVIGWCILSAFCLLNAPRRAAAPIALAWAFYFCTAGAVGHADPPLIWALKQLAHRTRPSYLHHSFSFPSGHTAAAVFIVGVLLTVLLPLALHLVEEERDSSRAQLPLGESSDSSSSGGGGSSAAALAGWDRPGFVYALWGVAALVTASGRVLADAHWVSDTLASCCLSVALVSALGCCIRPLALQQPHSQV